MSKVVVLKDGSILFKTDDWLIFFQVLSSMVALLGIECVEFSV
jgi:hypothetical protein